MAVFAGRGPLGTIAALPGFAIASTGTRSASTESLVDTIPESTHPKFPKPGSVLSAAGAARVLRVAVVSVRGRAWEGRWALRPWLCLGPGKVGEVGGFAKGGSGPLHGGSLTAQR